MRQSGKGKNIIRLMMIVVVSITLLFIISDTMSRHNETYAATTKAYTNKKLIPSGKVIGVTVKSEGICVVGISSLKSPKGEVSPAKNLLLKGDIIKEVNEQPVVTKEAFKQCIENVGEEPLMLTIERAGEEKNVSVKPIYMPAEESYKLGIWVKDGAEGIGTMTFIDPEEKTYGALGHGITDNELEKLLPIREGTITPATITSIQKGKKGEPGKLGGYITKTEGKQLGFVEKNTTRGIYGTLGEEGISYFEGKPLPIGLREDIHEGEAQLIIDLEGKGPTAYAIRIEKVSKYSSEPTKSMVIKIIDKKLIQLTNGIVQGMSGSPIVQDNKLIGAVTHVFVHEPTRGYGIFIENMLNPE